MSVVRCERCERRIDTYFDTKHLDECSEDHFRMSNVYECGRMLDGSIILCDKHSVFLEQNKDKSVPVGNIKFMCGGQEIEPETDEIASQWERDAVSRETPDAE
jgi:hypothetical protein